MLDATRFAAAALIAATVAAPVFAPIEEQTYRYLTIETRSDGAATYRFTVERRLVFARERGGWRATLTMTRAEAEAPPAMARTFLAAQRPLLDRAVVHHLSADGQVIAIDDEQALLDAVAAALLPIPRRAGAAEPSTPAASLARLPPERRRALLASAIEAVIAVDAPPAGDRLDEPVTLPARGVGGAAGALTGRRTITREAGGALLAHVEATGSPTPDTQVRYTRDRRIDPARGLLLDQRQTVDTMISDGAGARHALSTTITTLAPVR